jgi:acyl-CoA synthetase (AMP-forming)/AMP-acid ligase II
VISNRVAQREFDTIVDALRAHATEKPNALAYHYISDPRDGSGLSLSYSALHARARGVASILRRKMNENDRALLLFSPGLDYVVAFLGCLYAGVIAVPLYPPRKGEKLDRLVRVVQTCDARFGLATRDDIDRFRNIFSGAIGEFQSFDWIACNGEPSSEALDAGFQHRSRADIAFLQYTSGSTGDPKGVIVSHGNLVANQLAIAAQFETTSEDICLNWLPLYHDMGLIGSTLHPLFCGYPTYLMSHLAFVQDPLCWLENISRFKATVAGGPNFCYELCAEQAARRLDRVSQLSLSNWRLAFNGAEPIRAASMERFSHAFRGAGFHSRAFYPCYGLAEATLLVAGAKAGAGYEIVPVSSQGSTALVSSGTCVSDHDLLIVDSKCRPLPEGEAGEIWVSGPSVSLGYWNDADRTEGVFGAKLDAAYDRGRRYLRTGDLGFVSFGRLIVTGREKDLIVVNGRNYHPQDIETAAGAAHIALRAGYAAAFSIGDDESIVLVHEVKRQWLRDGDLRVVAQSIRRAVASDVGVVLSEIVFIKPATIPKTSSGKIRRGEARLRFIAGTLHVVDRFEQPNVREARLLADMPSDPSTAYLENALRELVALETDQSLDAIAPDTLLLGSGLNSIGLVRITHSFERVLDISLPAGAMFTGVTIREAARLLREACVVRMRPTTDVQELVAHDRCSLSYGQRQFWFAHQLDSKRSDDNLALLLECRPPLNYDRFVHSLSRACKRHAIFRTTYVAGDDDNYQVVTDVVALDVAQISDLVDNENALLLRLTDFATLPFDLTRGPLLRARLGVVDETRSLVLIATHHIASDLWSLAMLIEEIIAETSGSIETRVPARNYRDWVDEQVRYLRSDVAIGDRAYWKRTLAGQNSSGLSEAFPSPKRSGRFARRICRCNFGIDAATTGRLAELARRSNCTLNAVCLAIYQLVLHQRTGRSAVTVGTIAAGRSDWRFENTQGLFINPIVVPSVWYPRESFSAFLKRSALALTSGIVHQSYPFALVVKEHAENKRSAQHPLFQALFLMQQAQTMRGADGFAIRGVSSTVRINGVDVTSLPLDGFGSPFDLALTMAQVGDELEAMLEYNEAVIDAKDAACFATDVRRAIDVALEDPDAPTTGTEPEDADHAL